MNLRILTILFALQISALGFAELKDGFDPEEYDSAALAEESFIKFNASSRTRFRKNEDDDYRIQQRVKLGVQIDINGRFRVISMARTGDGSFQGANTDLYDDETGDSFDDIDIDINQLYLEADLNETMTASFGALNTRSSKGKSTALSSSGFIDGGRLTVDTKYGELAVTIGSLQMEEGNVGFYDRKYDFNYFEIAMDIEVYENMLLEVGFEQFNDDHYTRMALSGDLPVVLNTVFEYVVEGLYDHENNEAKWAAGVKFDLIELITGNSSAIRFQYSLTNLDRDFDNLRGFENASGIYSDPGLASVFILSGDINKKRGLEWFIRIRTHHDGGENRYETGFTWKFSN